MSGNYTGASILWFTSVVILNLLVNRIAVPLESIDASLRVLAGVP